MNKSNLYLALVVMFVLSGCGSVEERPCVHHLTIRCGRPHQPLTVTIRPVPVVPSHVEQHLVADSHGVATASFESSWNTSFLTFPRLGAVPPHSEKPDYVVLSGKNRFVISPETPGVQYRWENGGWFTDANLQP